MKCTNCNNELQKDAAFCAHCGKAVEKETLKKVSLQCEKCGGILMVDKDKSVLACPYCGSKELIIENDSVTIAKIKASAHKEIELEKIKSADRKQRLAEDKAVRTEERECIENFKKSKWFKLLIFAFLISAIFAYFYFSKVYILAGILATIQAICFGIAWSMGMQIIREKKRYVHVLVAITGILLIVPTFKACNVARTTAGAVEADWEIFFLGDVIPEPESNLLRIHSNTEEKLEVDVFETSEEEYYEYIVACKEFGYIIEPYESSRGYEAYNEMGYCVDLSYYTKGKMTIEVEAPTKVGDIAWEECTIGEILPHPESNVGVIEADDAEKTKVIIAGTSAIAFKEYCNLCKSSGFTIDVESKENSYIAYNGSGDKVNITYHSGKKEMTILLYYPMEFSEITWPRVGVATLAPIPNSLSGKVVNNSEWTYSVYVENSTREDFEDYVQKCIDAGFTKDIRNYENSFWADYSEDIYVNVSYEGYNIMYIKISGSIDGDYDSYTRDVDVEEEPIEEIKVTQEPAVTKEPVVTKEPEAISTPKPTNTPEPIQEIASEYEKAFVKKASSYSIYYMFNTDNGVVINFITNDTYIMEGTYSGDFSDGVDINWVNDGWHETFINKSGSNKATLIDGNSLEWQYEVCDIETAQKALDKLK